MIGVLVFPDFQLLDAAGPISVFEIAARFAGLPPSIKVLAATPGPVRSSSGVEMLARGFKAAGAHHDPDRGGRRGGGCGGDMQEDVGVRARRRKTRRPRRQRLLRRLSACRSRPARRPPRHHALAAHPAISVRLSQSEVGARPDLRPRRQHLEFGGDHRRHRSRAGDGDGGLSARRSRRKPRASSCSITAAAAASRNSRRCWN